MDFSLEVSGGLVSFLHIEKDGQKTTLTGDEIKKLATAVYSLDSKKLSAQPESVDDYVLEKLKGGPVTKSDLLRRCRTIKKNEVNDSLIKLIGEGRVMESSRKSASGKGRTAMIYTAI